MLRLRLAAEMGNHRVSDDPGSGDRSGGTGVGDVSEGAGKAFKRSLRGLWLRGRERIEF